MSGALDPSGAEARDLAVLFWIMTGLGAAVFVLVMTLLWRARHGVGEGNVGEGNVVEGNVVEGNVVEGTRTERRRNRLVLGGGVALPVVVLIPLVVAMLVVADRRAPRVGAVGEEISIVGHRFWWHIEYPGAGVVTANEVHIPTGTRVRLTMQTADVIHSVWVPQLAGKVDMIPGETTELILETDQPGVYQGYCAEFCGIQHARMRFLVVAHEPDDYQTWLDQQAQPAAEPRTEGAQRGKAVFDRYGCGACHRIAGTTFAGEAGPDLTHLASRRTLGAGAVANDRGQLAGWVANPQAVKPGNLMPPAPLSSQELLDLLDYLEGLE